MTPTTTYAVETMIPKYGWGAIINAGDTLPDAQQALADCDRDRPGQQHRLVKANADGTGWEVVVEE